MGALQNAWLLVCWWLVRVSSTVGAPEIARVNFSSPITSYNAEVYVEQMLLPTMRFPLELINVPEAAQERVLETVVAYGKRIGVGCPEGVRSAYRLPKFKRNLAPRKILFDLASRAEKNDWVMRNKNSGVRAADLDRKAQQVPIYVNEYLDRRLRKLLFYSKQFGRSIGYMKVWVSDGVVVMAKPRGSAPIHIESFDRLNDMINQWNNSRGRNPDYDVVAKV